jgi:predicted Holliday junction resolvase-like endonuclease
MIDQVWANVQDNRVLGTPDYWIVFTGISILGTPTDIKVPGYN